MSQTWSYGCLRRDSRPTTWGTSAGRVQEGVMAAGPIRLNALSDHGTPVWRGWGLRVKRCTEATLAVHLDRSNA